jgi:hypothetical protein
MSLEKARQILAAPDSDLGDDELDLAVAHALVSIADSLATIANAKQNTTYQRSG